MYQKTKTVIVSVAILIVLIVSCLFNGCSCSRISATSALGKVLTSNLKHDAYFPAKSHSSFVIEKDIDLKGKTFLMPENVTLVHKKGLIKNGTLIGNNTHIETKSTLFDEVHIKGTWNVPEVSTTLFANLNYENSLRDVMGLTSPNVVNNVMIEEGHYKFSPEKSGAEYVRINSNTKFTLNGTIEITPNPFRTYHIVSLEGTNIKISGKGTIIGDKPKHQSNKGEWGMGIYISQSSKCEVSDLTVKDCWGDCVYIGRGSKDILLSNLTLLNGRRQGISITDGENIKVTNTTISGVSGTAPAYAIDVEPNKGNRIHNVVLENININNCEGGIVVSVVHPDESWINGVLIDHCKVTQVRKKYSVRLIRCNNIEIKNSTIGPAPFDNNFNLTKVKNVTIRDNEIHTKNVVVNDLTSVIMYGNTIFGNDLYTKPNKKYSSKNNSIWNNKLVKGRNM